jgi:hypothetical protein
MGVYLVWFTGWPLKTDAQWRLPLPQARRQRPAAPVYLWPRRGAGKHQDAPVTLLDPTMVELGWLCFNLAMAADRGQTCGGF